VGEELIQGLDLSDSTSVAALAIKALVAPNDLRFSGHLVYELAARLLETRLELQRVNICEVADQLAEEEIGNLHLEVLYAAEWARKHLGIQKGSSRA
jgi:hypothetical protein